MSESSFSHIRDRELQELLIQKHVVTEAQIQAILTRQNDLYRLSHEVLRGQLYQINLDQHELDIKQSIESNLLNSIDLALDLQRDAHWQYWGEHLLILTPDKPELLQVKSWHPDNTIGLTLGESFAYLYAQDLAQQKYLIQSRQLIDPRMSDSPTKTAPYDLFLDSERTLLCLGDRGAGEIYLIRTDTYEVFDIFTVRDQSSQKAIVMEPDPKNKRIIFTDQIKPSLGILDYQEGMLEDIALDGRFPVHLQLKGNDLYVLISEPQTEILKLDSQNFEIRAQLKLPQDLHQKHHLAAANPFVLSEDGTFLAVLLGQNPDTEIVWIDTLSFELLGQKKLAGQPLPSQLVFGTENPLLTHRKRLAELLIDEDLISTAKLLQLFPPPHPEVDDGGTQLEIIRPETNTQHIEPEQVSELELIQPRKPLQSNPANPVHSEKKPDQLVVLEYHNPDEYQASLVYLSPIEHISSLPEPKPADNLPLPPSVIGDIIHMLTGAFYQQHGIDLQDEPEVMSRLQDYALEYKIKLQDHSIWPVDIPDLIVGHKLRTILLRDLILTMLDIRRTPNRYPYETPPTHCIECHVPLLGRWDCESCGLEFMSPERISARRIASATSRTWLPPGYFSIPDVQSGRLLLVNTHRHNYTTWQIDFMSLPGIQEPWDMLWLEDFHVLLTDRKANRVLELSDTGRIVWELDPEKFADLSLKEPIKTTCYDHPDGRHYLIVDQANHRVIEVDQKNRLHWSFGTRGKAGQDMMHLNLPTDVQYTPEQTYLITDTGNNRVLEISGDHVIRTYGIGLKLLRPVYALRLVNRNTLIADAGNFRLLEVNPNDELVREVHYFKSGMDERFDMSHPLKVVRRENQNVILIDTNRLMEVDLISKKIVWFSFLHELKFDLDLPTRLNQREIKVAQVNGEEVYQTVSAEHMPTIRRTLQKIPAFSDAPTSFLKAIEEKLKFRRYFKGEVILKNGQMGHALFIIQSGQVNVMAGEENTHGLTLEAGDSFGFMGIVYREARKSSITCQKSCGVYILDKRDFDIILRKYTEIEKKIQKLASERLIVSRLKQTPKTQQAADRLKSLMEKHRLKASERMSRITGPLQTIQRHDSHRLNYSDIEKKVIAEARKEHLSCLELHINLMPKSRMKAARVALIAALLDKSGTMIRTEPDPESILAEKFGDEVIMALLTPFTSEQIQEDILAVADIATVDIFPVNIDD